MEYPSFDLAGQAALVTGASRGLGHDLALALAHAGARVAVTARTVEDLRGVVDAVAAEGGEAHPIALDVRDLGAIERAVSEAVDRLGSLEILVNNAGVGTNHDAVDVTEGEWDEVLDVNLKGLFFCCRAAARTMLERGYGRIVNVSSQAGTVGLRRHAAYAASKGGVDSLTRVLALEWAPRGVTVNAVAPTFVRTPGTAERLDRPEFLADVVSRIPLGRVGTTTEVAAAVLFLASPASALVTGTVLAADGGWTAQ